MKTNDFAVRQIKSQNPQEFSPGIIYKKLTLATYTLLNRQSGSVLVELNAIYKRVVS